MRQFSTNCAVVILNWNGWQDSIQCIDSFFRTLPEGTFAVICDNGSTDGSLDQLRNWCEGQAQDCFLEIDHWQINDGFVVPRVTKLVIVRNEKNLGFAGGNNPGIRLAMNNVECRYIWLLNNDTTVLSSTLPEAIAHMEQNPSIGICGSTLVYFDDRDRIQAFGGAVYSRLKGRSRHIGAFSSLADVPADPQEVEQQMTYVVGASMLVRREFIEQVGYMQEDYFLYCEEIDWATRGKGRFRLGYAPKSVVFHKEGASIGTSAVGGSPLSLFFLFRNRVRFAWRFHRLYVLSVLFFCVVDVMKLLVRRRWPQAIAAIRGVLQLSRPIPVAKAQCAIGQG